MISNADKWPKSSIIVALESPKKTSKSPLLWFLMLAALFLLFAFDLLSGSIHIPVSEIIKIITLQTTSNEIFSDIFWDFRMPKAVTCVLAGGALALSGLQMQTLFRNALAGPDVLGLSSGASLAVSLIFMSNAVGLPKLETPWGVAASASLGCAIIFLVMLAVARRLKDNVSLLIVGLMVGAGTSSIVSVLQFLSKAEEMQVYIIWTFGSLGSLNWSEIGVLALALFTGSTISILLIKALNAWLLGDAYAQSLGVDIQRSRLLILLSTSILTGGVTAFCGPIAFVGLAVPHLTKLAIKTSNHKKLIPGVLIGGASLVLICDIISQIPANYILPINAITAIIGAPVVIWVILRKNY